MPKSIIMNVRLSPAEDKAVIEKICSAGSISGYIKSLIAKEIGMDYPDVAPVAKPKDTTSVSCLHISLNPDTDGAIIKKLNSVQNKSEYIRVLVYDDINSSKKKSFQQLCSEIDLDEYTDMAQFTAARFAELADIMRSNGFLAKASECTKLVDMLNNWAMTVK